MPNDDLGQFPTPTANSSSSNQPGDSQNDSKLEEISLPPAPTVDEAPSFEETPDEIPSLLSPESQPNITPSLAPDSGPTFTTDNTPPPDNFDTQATVTPPSIYQTQAPTETLAAEVPAYIAPKGGSAFGSLITIVLLLIAGIAIAGVVFLMSQSSQLKQQLAEITQTLNNQNTTVTPTPTSSIIEFTTPTPTPEATDSALPTLVISPSVSITPGLSVTPSTNSILPLADASKALKVAINHLPNAQLILIKTENASNPTSGSTKYFFRQDLTTKKYFYVLISGQNDPEVVDNAIYVSPDNNIPSLNDMVLGSTLGMDLDQAIATGNNLCTSGLCEKATIKAQYIKSGQVSIWQLAYDPEGESAETLIIQINAVTKEVIYKSAGF